MIITPVAWDNDNNPTMYESGPVYTVVRGQRVWVSGGYRAATVAEICQLAFINVQARQMVASLAEKCAWV